MELKIDSEDSKLHLTKFHVYNPQGKFEHQWFDEIELEQINSPLGRKYKTPKGDLYESVTTFLARLSDNEAIRNWKEAVGEEEATRVSKRATDRGTLLHKNIEEYLLNHTVHISKVCLIENLLFRSVVPTISKISNLRCLEHRLYSDRLKLAGTVDCVGDYDGVLSIIDFKSANGKKSKSEIEAYFLQTTIYSIMIEEMFHVKIPQLVIIIGVEAGTSQVFIEQRKNWIPKLVEMLRQK